MATEINWLSLSNAVDYYKSLGYKYMEVPWFVPDAPYEATKPPEAPSLSTIEGNLVASGEQSFMSLLDQGEKIEKAVCLTPCFRKEDKNDGLHLLHFMKVELINTNPTRVNLLLMINESLGFLEDEKGIECDIVDMGDGTYDIVGNISRVELGSYGIRNWNGFSWVYGTGIAEPRSSQVAELEKEYSGVV